MHLIELIKNQSALSYTGRINFLSATDKQYRGHLCMYGGELCYAQFDGVCGIEPLLDVIAQDLYLSPFSFVSEPETIDKKYILFRKQAHEIVNEARNYYRNYLYAHKKPPPAHLKLTVDVNNLYSAESLTPREFEVLEVISRYGLVDAVIKHSKLSRIQCIMILVSLREKKILKVLKEVVK